MLAPAPNGRPVVVIVDDDVALRSALTFALEIEGFVVEARGSGEELLAQSLPSDHGCLVIDERLPGIGGLQALQALRARNVDLPALLITTNPNAPLRKAAMAAGVPIVEKPLICDALVQSIREALAV
jgi:FixJ family two-component response regulator